MSEKKMDLIEIGTVEIDGDQKIISIKADYAEALTGLEGFSHMLVFWWANKYDEYRFQSHKIVDLPYAPGEKAGLFATRSPVRFNPVCVSVCDVRKVSVEEGIIKIADIDAAEGSPVVDIKPYYGCSDRVRKIKVPNWVPSDWSEWWKPEKEEIYG